MKPILKMWVLILCLPVACQHSSSVKQDTETGGTETETETAIVDSATATNTDSETRDTESDTGTISLDSATAASTDSETNDTAIDTTTADSDTSSETETVPLDTDTADSAIDTGSDTESLPDPVENEWVYIEGGSYEMGHEGEDTAEMPVHTVSVPSFEILKTEVTVHQYRQCFDAGVCTAPHQSGTICSRTYDNNWILIERLNYPINCIDHFQATEYCHWLGGRLLSESEWEYAARSGGQDIDYPWGNDSPTCELVAATEDLDDAPPGPSCWSGGGLPVCSKPLGNSIHGLCDMSGNYAEWVADIVYAAWGYEGAPIDGSPRIETDYDGAAIFRGGNAFDGLSALHVYDRASRPVDYTHGKDMTIRCARNAD